MNRRGFLKLLAGAAAFTLSAPVIRLIPGAPILAECARAYNTTEAQCVMREILDNSICAQFEEESHFYAMFDDTSTFVEDGSGKWYSTVPTPAGQRFLAELPPEDKPWLVSPD